MDCIVSFKDFSKINGGEVEAKGYSVYHIYYIYHE